MMEPNAVCPNCSKVLEGERSHSTCGECGATWVREEVLRGCIRAFLLENGVEESLVAFHERPSSDDKFQCSTCKRSLAHVILRGVDAYRCQGCGFVLLAAGTVELLSQRVLVSASNRKPLHPLTRNAQLEAILMDPTRWGVGN
jgi:ribosomal protein L37AE/L43A